MKKYITQKVDGYSVIDEFTGELLEYKQTKVITQEEFILFFLTTIPDFIKLEGNQMKLLVVLWKISSFNTFNSSEGNIIHNSRSTKNAIRDMGLDLSDKSIDLYFSQLSKLGFLIRRCRGEFMLNPKYFFKGRLSDATKLQFTIKTSNWGNPKEK